MSINTASALVTEPAPPWYLVHCKPRQDERAEDNLLRQSYGCYRPRHSRERIVRGRRQTVVESLFPGYLFIQQRAATAAEPVFEIGDSVRITAGSFVELDAIFMAMDGEQRVILLLDMLNRQQQVRVPLVSIVKN